MKSYNDIINDKFPHELKLIHELTYTKNLKFTTLDSYIKATKDVLYNFPSPHLEYDDTNELQSFLEWLIIFKNSKENNFSIDLKHARFTNPNSWNSDSKF